MKSKIHILFSVFIPRILSATKLNIYAFTLISFVGCDFAVVVQVVDMETEVLKFLNFEMGIPTTKTFLR